MTFILDTGSPWMWLPGQKCPEKECSGNRYTKSYSTTYSQSEKVIDIKYGKGYVEGNLAEDQIAVVENPIIE